MHNKSLILSTPEGQDSCATQSPVGLTEQGKKKVAKLKAQQIVDKYVYRMMHLISDDTDNLGVQDICLNFALNNLINLMTHEERQELREYVYEHENGNMTDALTIYAILFRDKVLENRTKDKKPNN